MEEVKKDFKIFKKFKNQINNYALIKSKRGSAPILFDHHFLKVEDLFDQSKINKKEKHYLLVKKINLKDKKNKYYTKAVKKIFSDVDKYLEHKYEDKKVIVGKGCTSKGLKELRDYFFRRNKRKRTVRRNDIKSTFFPVNKTVKNKGIHILADATKNTSSDTIKNMHLISGVEYVKKYPLSDNELKKIFQDSVEREKKNKNEIIDLSTSSELYQKIDNNTNKSSKVLKINTERMNINNMLNLQEKILKDRIKKIEINKRITNKIMSATLKENSKLLMNNKKHFLVIKNKEIDKDNTNFEMITKEDKVLKDWISKLRINKYKEYKKINSNKKEIIYYNKDINTSRDINYKLNKTILNQLINNHNILKAKSPSIFSKYKNENSLLEKNNIKKENSYNTLFIKGKNLLEHEMKLSKDLIGKKKKIMHYSYPIEEISDVLLAKTKNLDIPKAIVNSIEIHNF